MPCILLRQQPVDHQIQNNEDLTVQVILRLIVIHAPDHTDHKGKGETGDIQHPPALPVVHDQNGDGKHQIIGEQRDIVTAAGGEQHRCRIAADHSQDRQADRVLYHRKENRCQADNHHQRQCKGQRQELIKLIGGKYRDIKRTEAAALNNQAVQPVFMADTPADNKECY